MCLSSSFINLMISFLLLVRFFPTTLIPLFCFVPPQAFPLFPSLVFLFFHSLASLFVIFTALLLLLGVSHILFLRFYSFFIFFFQVNRSLFPPSQHLSTFYSVLVLCLYSFFIFLPWRISSSTALFTLSYETVACDICNSIKFDIKLTFSLIVYCITYTIE